MSRDGWGGLGGYMGEWRRAVHELCGGRATEIVLWQSGFYGYVICWPKWGDVAQPCLLPLMGPLGGGELGSPDTLLGGCWCSNETLKLY